MAPYTQRQRAAIVIVAFACTVLDGADFSIFLFFMKPLAAQLGASLVDLSLIQASSYIIGIVGGVAFGRYADKRGRRLGLLTTVVLFSVFTAATALVDSYVWLFVVRVIAGIGIGGESGIAFAYVNEALPGRDQRRGLASGLLQSMFLVGLWLAAFIYAQTSSIGPDGWRTAFVLLGGVGIACAVACYFIPESHVWLERMKGSRASGGSMQQVRLSEILRGEVGRRMLISSGLLTASFFGAYAVFMYGPAMWQSVFQLDAASVGRIGMVSAGLGAASYICGGYLADRIGRRRAYMVTASVGVISYATFAACLIAPGSPQDKIAIMVPAYFFLQIGYGYFGVQGVWLSELFPTEVRTTAQNAVYYIGRALGAGAAPVGALMIAQNVGWDVSAAVAFGIVGALLALILSSTLPETRGKLLDEI